jgi:hypothetical protein
LIDWDRVEKRAAVSALQHFLYGLTELLERIEKQRKASISNTNKTESWKNAITNDSLETLSPLAFALTFLEFASAIENFLPHFVPSQRLAKVLLKFKAKHLIVSLFPLKTEKGRQELLDFYKQHSLTNASTTTATLSSTSTTYCAHTQI